MHPLIETFKRYRRKQIAELTDWHPGFDMTGISISDADKAAGSPKTGDKIARNPVNHADKWLVAADYFAANFESALPQSEINGAGEAVAWVIPGDYNARSDGWLDARVDKWGEFTKPLYAAPAALPKGLVCGDVAISTDPRYAGWVFCRHVDGVNWTTCAKMTPETWKMLAAQGD